MSLTLLLFRGGGGESITNVALMGSAEVESLGTLVATIARGITGSASTESHGSVGALIAIILAGSTTTESSGTLSPTASVGLVGSTEAEQLGELTALVDVMTNLEFWLLQHLAKLHGLTAEPLVNTTNARTVGGYSQTLSEVGSTFTVTPDIAPPVELGVSRLNAEQRGLLMKLAQIHGLIDPLVVTPTTRGAGSVQQTITEVGTTVTVTLQ